MKICRGEIGSGTYQRSRHAMRPIGIAIGVYLIHVRRCVGSDDWAWMKVGASERISGRLSGLDAAHAGSKLIHLIECPSVDAARALESMLHAVLAARGRARRATDYFQVTAEDARWIRSMERFEDSILDALKALR